MSYQQIRPGGFQFLSPVIKNIIIINALVLLAQFTADASGYHNQIFGYFALHSVHSSLFMPHQLLTHIFMHGDFGHFFYNMFALWLFGNKLENFWGSKKFLIFYVLSGIGAALIHLGWLSYEMYPIIKEVSDYTSSPSLQKFLSYFQEHGVPSSIDLDEVKTFAGKWAQNLQNPAYISDSIVYVKKTGDYLVSGPTVGASGAVFGCLAAFGYLFPNSYIYFNLIFPIKAKWLVLFYTAGEIYMVYTNSGGNVAHFAHLGGALIGFLLVLFWNKTNRNTFY